MVFGLTDRPDLESMAKLNNLARLVKIICRGKVVDRHYTSYDHAITIYHKPSIDTNRRLHKANGMLVPFTDDGERC